MTDEKKSFILYREWRDIIQELTLEQRGILITAIFDVVNGNTPLEMDGMTKICFKVMHSQINRDAERWEDIRKKRKEAGEKSAEARAKQKEANQTNANFVKHKETNPTVSVNDNVTVDDNVTQSPQKPPVGADVCTERFETFWKAYPRKVGKGAAEKIFKKLNPSGEILQKMLDAIEAQSHSDQWKRDNGQYVPNPATWLNQTRWEDEGTAQPNSQDISLDEFFS